MTMWAKPWTMKEGFLIGGCLVFAGLMLQLSIGPVVWKAFGWPVNGIVLAGFLAMIALMFLLRKKVYAFQFVGTSQAAIPAMVYAVLLTIVMGLTLQEDGGTWLNDMLFEKRRSFLAEPPWTFCGTDDCYIGQCRYAARKDDYHHR